MSKVRDWIYGWMDGQMDGIHTFLQSSLAITSSSHGPNFQFTLKEVILSCTPID